MRSIRLAALLCAASTLTGAPAFAGEPISFIGPVTLPNGQPSVSNRLVGPSDPLPVTSLIPWSKDAATAVTLSPTTSTSTATHLTGTGPVAAVENTGTVDVYALTSASSSVQAATTDVVIHPGQVQPMANLGYISFITATGTAAVRVTTGAGDPRPGLSTNVVTPAQIAGADGATVASASNPLNTVAPKCAPYGYLSGASNNATSAVSTAKRLCSLTLLNRNAGIYYFRLYDLATSPTCSSATGYLLSVQVPANTSAAGVSVSMPPGGWSLGNGFAFCITGGETSTDNTNAATGVEVIASTSTF